MVVVDRLSCSQLVFPSMYVIHSFSVSSSQKKKCHDSSFVAHKWNVTSDGTESTRWWKRWTKENETVVMDCKAMAGTASRPKPTDPKDQN